MRLFVLIFVGLLGVTGCRQEAPELPLSDDLLIEVLMDLHLAEASMQRVPVQWRDSLGADIRSRVAVSYGLTPDELQSIIGQLQLQPEKSAALYDSVIARLEVGQTEFE